jgi:hypothetical protein
MLKTECDEKGCQIVVLEKQLKETKVALIDLWKAFTSPTSAEEQKAAMDKHEAVIKKIIDR